MNHNPLQMKMRDAYGETLMELAASDDSIVFVSADCGGREREFFKQEGKGRLVETGIAESNSAGVAAGLAAEGFKPYILNFAYLLGRMYNHISQSICEDSYKVNITAYYAGVWGIGGRSHNCVTDLSIMRALPNLSILAPADYWETKAVVKKADSMSGPTYVRISGVPTPTVFDQEPEYAPVRRITNGNRCTIFCHGTMVHTAIQADLIGSLGASVVNVSQLKPLPTQEIIAEARRTGKVVVAEEHSSMGGLGEAICSLLSEHDPMPVRLVAVPDMFPFSVLMEEPDVFGKYGISHKDIIRAVESLSAR